MWLKKYRIIINIESDKLHYQVIKSLIRKSVIAHEGNIDSVSDNMADIEVSINKLLEIVPSTILKNTVFEINIDPNHIQKQILALPDAKLLTNEITLLVEASIYKLFQLPAKNIMFDYIEQLSDKNQLTVVICERHYIHQWIELFAKLNLSLRFIGLSFDDNKKVNFLSWRKVKQKREKIQLATMAAIYLSVTTVVLSYLWWQAQSEQAEYSHLVTEQQAVQQKLLHKLSLQLPNHSQSQRQLQQSLLILSEKMPAPIWLESFSYVPQKINITGYSFIYPEITRFAELLIPQLNIKKSQIQSVAINHDGLQFQMDIDLDE